MKRSLMAVFLAGVLLVASPATAWAFNRDVGMEMRHRRLDGVRMLLVTLTLALRPEQNPPHDCLKDVPVRLQRFKDGWRTIESGRTDNDGKVTFEARDRTGRYRGVAPEYMTPGGSDCFRGVSDVMRHRH